MMQIVKLNRTTLIKILSEIKRFKSAQSDLVQQIDDLKNTIPSKPWRVIFILKMRHLIN